MTTISKITASLFAGTFLKSLKLPAHHCHWFFEISDLIVQVNANCLMYDISKMIEKAMNYTA